MRLRIVLLALVGAALLVGVKMALAAPAEQLTAPGEQPSGGAASARPSSPARCTAELLSSSGQHAVDVPSFCIGGLCQILIWTDGTMGAFGPGLSWPVFYTQDPLDGSWIGGPSIHIAGYSFSLGGGVNGDSAEQAIFAGGWTNDLSSVGLYDDGYYENSPSQWTIEFDRNDSELTEASLYVCPLTYERYDVTSDGEYAVQVPDYCIDGMCGIVAWRDAAVGAFLEGLSWPAFYQQDSADGSWIGGPVLSIAGDVFSEGGGVNGDASAEMVFGGGQATAGGYVRLHDDFGAEASAEEWTIEFKSDAYLTEASYFIYPLTCVRKDVTAAGQTVVDVPRYCTHGMCTVLMWTNATIGAFGPGLHWPDYYHQSPVDNSWIGGPAVAVGGTRYSAGAGVNGDGVSQAVLEGGVASDGGSIHLYDDYGSESSSLRWSAVFDPDVSLTEGAYFICAGTCMQHDVYIPTAQFFLPAIYGGFLTEG